MVPQKNVLCALMIFISGTLAQSPDDPCHIYNDVISHGGRSPRCPYEKTDEKCDEFLTPSWFRVKVGEDNEFPRMTSYCPEPYSCGANYPIWLNGTHPTVEEGIVNRAACLRYADNCCEKKSYIQIKNCTEYFVYFLSKASTCPGRYCFDSDVPCPTPPMTASSMTTSSITTSSMTSTTVNSTAAVSLFLHSRVLTCVLSVQALLIF
ncbi:pancreatic secretory granule membrane major glycoprotein GP2-like [Haliotis rubra]|uniref:pancreatic secretory granule membrane major glycoprotein GP2-like n=1 Tax=Haliotis rubra TaxID=36100 RepID=UPI001EE52270|nr:pancreatic secretory granule membrane major glycoprotein GP2-like [Haliotis rubra]